MTRMPLSLMTTGSTGTVLYKYYSSARSRFFFVWMDIDRSTVGLEVGWLEIGSFLLIGRYWFGPRPAQNPTILKLPCGKFCFFEGDGIAGMEGIPPGSWNDWLFHATGRNLLLVARLYRTDALLRLTGTRIGEFHDLYCFRFEFAQMGLYPQNCLGWIEFQIYQRLNGAMFQWVQTFITIYQ